LDQLFAQRDVELALEILMQDGCFFAARNVQTKKINENSNAIL